MNFARTGDSSSPEQMPEWLQAGPSLAETARTVLAGASSLRLGITHGGVEVVRHVVAVDGSLVMLLDDAPGVVADLVAGRRAAAPMQLKAVDVAPIATAHRVRATVVSAGRLALLAEQLPDEVVEHLAGPGGVWAERPLMRFVPRRIVLEEATPRGVAAAHPVDLDAYRHARTDPLLGLEADWLNHLDRDHPDVVRALGRAGHGETVRPHRLDRHGLVLKVTGAAGAWHLRLPFEQPVVCGCDLVEAVNLLVQRAMPEGDGWCG